MKVMQSVFELTANLCKSLANKTFIAPDKSELRVTFLTSYVKKEKKIARSIFIRHRAYTTPIVQTTIVTIRCRMQEKKKFKFPLALHNMRVRQITWERVR